MEATQQVLLSCSQEAKEASCVYSEHIYKYSCIYIYGSQDFFRPTKFDYICETSAASHLGSGRSNEDDDVGSAILVVTKQQ